ncbi:flagellar hook-basal body protein [Burkholderia cepacia]|uniref:Flagellar hook-basal body family protein n=1 Tax=Burkholderia cepacia TaxID=292 RepID=A0AA89CJB4_BURCE|nr:flagellar hook-basal body protein [Burkholderia cepacia]KGB99338.1 flagellar hook-basal body family protein [Burkholderia cepacia]
MDDLMTLATGLISRETRRVETAAQNVANVATPGYKRQIAFDEAVSAHRSAGSLDAIAAMLPRPRVATDFSPGKLVHTGNPLDLSIAGPGFFEVTTPSGPAYTRLGSFQRDADGRLVTARGWVLQAAGGGDVVLRSNDWHIERDGTVIDGGNPVAVIRVATFTDRARLTRVGNELFVADGATAFDADRPQIAQGFVESSNAAVGNDMVQVMEAMRRVEAGQKLVHSYDDMIGAVLQRLGDM